MSELMNELKKKLSFLDCSQNNIQHASEEFMKIAVSDETSMEDLVKLWKFFCINKQDKLAFIFLANDIIQNSFFRNLKLHDVFFNHLIEVFPTLCNSLNEKLRKEISRVLEIWEERKIYEPSKLDNLRQLLSVTTIPASNTLDNPLFQSFIKNNKIQISEKIKEFAGNLEEFKKLKNLQEESANNNNNNNNNFNTNVSEDMTKKNSDILNMTRGKLLKNAADTIKKQNQAYFKHVYYLQEVEKMLDRISFSKKVAEKSDEMLVDN